jgi:hypothetical protein
MQRTVHIAALAVALALAVTACASPGPGTPTGTGTGSPTSSAAPTPTPVERSSAEIPSDCVDRVSTAVYQAAFADTPLNDPAAVGDMPHGAVDPIVSPPGSSAQTILADSAELVCLWRHPDADITGILVTLGTVDPAVARQRLDELAAEGYVCESRLDGTQCQKTEVEPQYGVDAAITVFLRDETWVLVNQANLPTDDLIGAIVERVWR